jgi:CRISPR/Cas system-associated exonuclease Cas4 (RecB family)
MNPVKDLRIAGPREHHPHLSPSSLPAIMQCACYTGRGESDDDAEKGQNLHEYTQDVVFGVVREPGIYDLEKSEIEAAQWAANEVKVIFDQYAPGEDIRIEEKLRVFDAAGREISSGYADFNGGCVVVDLKSGLDFRPDMHWHKPQLCAYALAAMQRDKIDRAYCMEIYILPMKKRDYWVTRSECEANIAAAIARRNNPDKYPLVNDFCKWCARMIWCPAINALAYRTAELYAKASVNVAQFADPDCIKDPDVMAQALTLSKKVLEPLQKRIDEAALKLSETKEIPYYVRTQTNPHEKIVDVRKAFDILPFDNKEFCKALSTTPKKVAEVYAEKFDLPEAQAKRTVYGLLDTLIVKGESKPTLKPLLQNQTKKRGKRAA